jgi:hypothetical protein
LDCGAGEATGVADGAGSVAVGEGVGAGVGVGVGVVVGVGDGVGVDVGLGVGFLVGLGVGFLAGEGLGVGTITTAGPFAADPPEAACTDAEAGAQDITTSTSAAVPASDATAVRLFTDPPSSSMCVLTPTRRRVRHRTYAPESGPQRLNGPRPGPCWYQSEKRRAMDARPC